MGLLTFFYTLAVRKDGLVRGHGRGRMAVASERSLGQTSVSGKGGGTPC